MIKQTVEIKFVNGVYVVEGNGISFSEIGMSKENKITRLTIPEKAMALILEAMPETASANVEPEFVDDLGLTEKVDGDIEPEILEPEIIEPEIIEPTTISAHDKKPVVNKNNVKNSGKNTGSKK